MLSCGAPPSIHTNAQLPYPSHLLPLLDKHVLDGPRIQSEHPVKMLRFREVKPLVAFQPIYCPSPENQKVVQSYRIAMTTTVAKLPINLVLKAHIACLEREDSPLVEGTSSESLSRHSREGDPIRISLFEYKGLPVTTYDQNSEHKVVVDAILKRDGRLERVKSREGVSSQFNPLAFSQHWNRVPEHAVGVGSQWSWSGSPFNQNAGKTARVTGASLESPSMHFVYELSGHNDRDEAILTWIGRGRGAESSTETYGRGYIEAGKGIFQTVDVWTETFVTLDRDPGKPVHIRMHLTREDRV